MRVEAGSGMHGFRAKVRRQLADPNVTVVVVEHRGRLGRVNTELAETAHGRRLVVLDDGEADDDLAEALTRFCAGSVWQRAGQGPGR
jgi:putative resolvase